MITFVILYNDKNGPFVLIRHLNHFLLILWPEVLLELSACHLRCIPLTVGMVWLICGAFLADWLTGKKS